MLIYLLDCIGIIACSIAASMLAKRVGFDLSGAILVAVVGSIGGGTTRDLLLNRHPLFWLHQPSYLILITLTALLVQIFYHTFDKLNKPLRLFDAIGLAAFSVIGFNAAHTQQMSAPIIVLMGMITAVIGGILRDIICHQLPLVLRQEIYIFASILGGLLYLALQALNTPDAVRDIASMSIIFIIRMLAIKYHWNLPNLTLKP
ncbi:trimeric intracellular cation channel family protein [Rappaport israeli]|uniref:trimeric intracellular cation channel family protein n=1 Tax=Rappaport israeli TaxID=1839807 RepID=UPI000931D12E|nr:trimeric intracellular cation channel family protein [Rappaport israeli]